MLSAKHAANLPAPHKAKHACLPEGPNSYTRPSSPWLTVGVQCAVGVAVVEAVVAHPGDGVLRKGEG